MTLSKSLIIGAFLFIAGVVVQGSMDYPATSMSTMTWVDYLYATLYVVGIGFSPIYAGISKLFNKK